MADSVWNLLKKFQFNIDLTENRDLVCIICRNLLNNPHKSLCKCKFCLDCFKSYYFPGVKYCPGKSDNCNQNILDVMEYLQFDRERSNKIIELIVNCPLKSCKFQTALKHMEQHLNSHYSSTINENESFIDSNRNPSQFDNICLSLLFNKFDDLQMKFNFFQKKFTKHIDIFNREMEYLIDTIMNNSKKLVSMKEIIVKKNDQIKQLEDQLEITMASQNSQIDLIKQANDNYKIENEKLQRKLEMLSWKLSSFNNDFNNRKESVREIKHKINDLNPTVKNELQDIYENLDLILSHRIESEKKQRNLHMVIQQRNDFTENKENQFANSYHFLKPGTALTNENNQMREDARKIWLQKRKDIFTNHENDLKNIKKVRQ